MKNLLFQYTDIDLGNEQIVYHFLSLIPCDDIYGDTHIESLCVGDRLKVATHKNSKLSEAIESRLRDGKIAFNMDDNFFRYIMFEVHENGKNLEPELVLVDNQQPNCYICVNTDRPYLFYCDKAVDEYGKDIRLAERYTPTFTKWKHSSYVKISCNDDITLHGEIIGIDYHQLS